MRCALLRLGLSATLALANSSAFAQTDEIINFEHIDRTEFAIHLDWLDLDSADEETLVRAVYEEYLESAKDLEQSWLLVLHWGGRWETDNGVNLGDSAWRARLSILEDWQQYRQFVGDEIEHFQERYFDDLRALLPDREETIERLEMLRFRMIFFDNRRTISFRDMPDIVMTILAIALSFDASSSRPSSDGALPPTPRGSSGGGMNCVRRACILCSSLRITSRSRCSSSSRNW